MTIDNQHVARAVLGCLVLYTIPISQVLDGQQTSTVKFSRPQSASEDSGMAGESV